MLKVITPAARSDLTELSAVKRDLGISEDDASQDERLSDLIWTASDLVTQHCNRDTFGLELVEQTERPHGTGPIILARDLSPVIESVTENGVELPPEAYYLDGSLLHRFHGAAPAPGTGTPYAGVWVSNGFAVLSPFAGGGWCGRHVVIRYTAGFELLGGLPRAIEQACLDVVFSLHASAGRDPSRIVRSETVEGIGSVTYATSAAATGGAGGGLLPIAPDRLAALERWRYRPGFG